MESRVDQQGLQHAILTCVTAGPGLAFNRAALFLADEEREQLVATMAIGPGTREEASGTWALLSGASLTLEQLLRTPPQEPDSEFQRQVEGLVFSLASSADAPNPLVEAYRERQIVTSCAARSATSSSGART